MNEKHWAILGKVAVFVLVCYLLLWVTIALGGTLKPVGRTLHKGNTAFLECRVMARIPLLPAIVVVAGAPMEWCQEEKP